MFLHFCVGNLLQCPLVSCFGNWRCVEQECMASSGSAKYFNCKGPMLAHKGEN